ncbi:MAG: class I SAM-dependent methyltransferase [Bacteroidota bacterium]
MPDEKTIYASDAERYEALIRREDFQGNIQLALDRIIDVKGLHVLDVGAGTGRLAGMLAGRAATVRAFDISHHMLTVARDRLRGLAPRHSLAAVADHRRLPLPGSCADLVISGWSVSYLAVWAPGHWRGALDAWMIEMRRVLRPRGMIVLFESLGTGNETPWPLPHLENFYAWLRGTGFQETWIRTDYRFASVEEAAALSGFFFGEETAARIRRESLTLLPECTGVWWRSIEPA